VTPDWADLALVVAIVVAGCGASYFLLLGKLRRTLVENQREMEHRLAMLTEAIRAGTPLASESATDALTSAEIESEAAVVLAVAAPNKDDQRAERHAQEIRQQEEIAPEIQVAIAAAAIAALGNHARVRSARRIPSSDVVSPWTQQGRVIVQSSHNLRTQGSR
jgi:hypothetical protein